MTAASARVSAKPQLTDAEFVLETMQGNAFVPRWSASRLVVHIEQTKRAGIDRAPHTAHCGIGANVRRNKFN